ncbi:MAG: hypothetical protein K2I56_03115 [Muribaculaceae bacterium]|nr:hypothetical protein [Muribaculaceae bacterium]
MNEMQTVKRHFFAMRNGIIADTLRRAGSPYHIIFGLNLPQLSDIAAMTPHTVELADALHANASTRCSRLMAPMLHPAEDMTAEKAGQWIDDVLCAEEADILCHRLLRRLPFAPELVAELPDCCGKWQVYTRLRLLANLRAIGRECPDVDISPYLSDPHPEIASLARMLSE